MVTFLGQADGLKIVREFPIVGTGSQEKQAGRAECAPVVLGFLALLLIAGSVTAGVLWPSDDSQPVAQPVAVERAADEG